MNYVYEGLDAVVSEDDVKNNKVFPLVRELRFKHNLQVFNMYEEKKWSESHLDQGFALCNPMGIAIAKVWYEEKEEQFCYYSTWYEKSRGSDTSDRKTLRSKKLSSLMSTLKKNEVVPSEEKVTKEISSGNRFNYRGAVDTVRDKMGSCDKNNPFNPDDIHPLLEILLEGKPYDSLPDELKNKVTQTLDNYKQKDNIKKARDGEVNRFFGSCYALFVDGLGQYVVGVIKHKYIRSSSNIKYDYDAFDVVKPFKRFADIDALGVYPDLVSYLTMLKTYAENKNHETFYGYVPRTNAFFEDLDMVVGNTYIDGSKQFTVIEVYTPCSM
jgi:hypothetical protein